MKRKSDCTPEEWARIWAAEKARRARQKDPAPRSEDGTRAYRRASPAPVVRDPIYDHRRDGGADDRDATARWMGDPPAWRRQIEHKIKGANYG